MRLLNLGAGNVRPPPPFINLDTLHSELAPGTPERKQLDLESNYINHDIRSPLPFPDNYFSGLLCSHCLEHFDVLGGTALLKECLRVLESGGYIMVSVPDASYHRKVYSLDNKSNCLEIFGETIPESEPKQTFLEYALFFTVHLTVYCEDSLWAMLVNAGFRNDGIWKCSGEAGFNHAEITNLMHAQLNRRKFSLVMVATK